MTTLVTSAGVPVSSRNGMSGMIAPTKNAREAADGRRPRPADVALGSRPTSSRIIVSRADSSVANSFSTIVTASSAREAALLVDAHEDQPLALAVLPELARLELELGVEQLVLRPHGDVLAHGHREGAREQARDARDDDRLVVRGRTRDAHHQRQVGDQAVAAAEDGRAQERGGAALVGRGRGAGDAGEGRDPGDRIHGPSIARRGRRWQGRVARAVRCAGGDPAATGCAVNYNVDVNVKVDVALGGMDVTPEPRLLRIAEVGELLGMTARAIRYYEELGLLEPAARSDGAYRLYDADDVERLRPSRDCAMTRASASRRSGSCWRTRPPGPGTVRATGPRMTPTSSCG